jgi:N-acetylmuramoyl-L-alanine amidase
MLVLHYTGMPDGEAALARLRDPDAEVSAHYLVEEDGRSCAWCPRRAGPGMRAAGVWQGETDCNAASIGIEIVNPGHEFGYRAFPEAQIEAVIALTADIRTRWSIPDARIIAHSDLAPERKEDPGELLPVEAAGPGRPRPVVRAGAERIAALGGFAAGRGRGDRRRGAARRPAPAGLRLQPGSTYDAATAATVKAFQRHWRQDRSTGSPTAKPAPTLMGVLQLATAESVTGVLN